MAFNPALIIVDFQEDFCPPNGSLAVPQGRDIAPSINHLLTLPFTFKLATRDYHPPSHISFAANHPGSPPPFTSSTTIVHPDDPSRSYTSTLWPVHCVADTPGAQIVPELDAESVHLVLDKGHDPRVEMYSAFYDPFHVEDSGLAAMLRNRGITHVYVVGLAADFCVKATAEHAFQEGFKTFIIEEATRPVMPDSWPHCRDGIVAAGVDIISMDDSQVKKVEQLSATG